MNKTLILITLLLLSFFKISPHWSLLLGLCLTFILKLNHEDQAFIKNWSGKTLQYSIILLGSSLNFHDVLNQGTLHILLTFGSISLVMIMGYFLGAFFKVPNPLSTLISSGTAICGGSAIGAIGPALNADNLSMAISLGVVFLLNAFSIFVLPEIGHFFQLTENQFGIWAALAIHDTSAVVAASSLYGEKALTIATTLKLTRALWIIPLALTLSGLNKTKNKVKYPWFILFFLTLSVIFTFIPEIHFLISNLKIISKIGFSLSLFLIGLNLSKSQLKAVEIKTILFGTSLWLLTLICSFIYVKNFS